MKIVLLTVVLALAIGCVSPAPTAIRAPSPTAVPTVDLEATIAAMVQAALPTVTPTPTPDIDATVEARLQAILEAIPTLTPPSITLDPETGSAGETISFFGTGFPPSRLIETLIVGGVLASVDAAVSDADGQVDTKFSIPSSTSLGSQQVELKVAGVTGYASLDVVEQLPTDTPIVDLVTPRGPANFAEAYPAAAEILNQAFPTATPTPRPTPTPDAPSHYVRGKEHLDEGKYEFATDEFTKAIDLNPDYSQAYNSRGIAYDKLQQYQRAIQDYDQSIRKGLNHASGYYNRGNAYSRLDQNERAIQDYDKAIQLDHNYAKAYSNRGRSYDELGQYERAIQDYDQVIRLDPDDAVAYFNRGIVYYHLDQNERAIQDLDKAIRLDPDFAYAYYNRSIAYHNIGLYPQADADKAKACSLDISTC